MNASNKSGLYFERKKMTQEIGHTAKDAVNEIHYFASFDDEGKVSLEVVNFEGKKTGIAAELVERKAFSKRFKPCSYHDCRFKLQYMEPEEREIKEQVIRGNDYLKKDEFHGAEKEFESALKKKGEHLKANLGLGKVYLRKGNRYLEKSVRDGGPLRQKKQAGV